MQLLQRGKMSDPFRHDRLDTHFALSGSRSRKRFKTLISTLEASLKRLIITIFFGPSEWTEVNSPILLDGTNDFYSYPLLCRSIERFDDFAEGALTQ